MNPPEDEKKEDDKTDDNKTENDKKDDGTTDGGNTEDGNKDPVQEESAKVTKVTLNRKSVTLNKGKTITLKASVAPANAANKKVTWRSSNKNIAVVSRQGKVKAVGKGTAKITVTTEDGKKTAVCTVKVKVPAKKLTLNTKKLYIVKGKGVKLKAVKMPSESTDKVSWTSIPEKVATVKNGKIGRERPDR